MNARPLLLLAAIAAATSPDMGKGALDRFKGGVRDGFARDPMGSVLAAVLGGAWMFYKAERGHNPKVKSYYDALVYVSTNLSVGYSDIFAKTARGKAIGTALMTYGPAMAAKIFDTPTAPTAPVVAPASAPATAPPTTPVIAVTGPTPVASPAPPAASALIGSTDVLDRLDRILAVLEANRDAIRAAQPPAA
jgi:voltage-gated potassium channel